MLPWILCLGLSIAAALLGVKLWLLRKSLDEIRREFRERLSVDTNTLISISSGDARTRRLAAEMNTQLRLLRRQRRQYLSGDRELKEAVTNISHDLRTPLTAICGYLDLLENEGKSEEAARYLSLITNRAEALKQLTEELFRYSVILSAEDELQPEPLSLNAALEESLAAFYPRLTERGIVPAVTMPRREVRRNLDKAAVSRVLGNVLSNALKYSNGDLAVSLSESGELVFSNMASGLSEVQIERLFDRFYTVETARNSTGLGLAIAKRLVEQMQGEIAAHYADGRLSICIRFQGG